MARMRHNTDWFALALDSWSMGVEASAVIGLRMVRLAGGGAAAESEARLMVTEKFRAALDLQALAMRGALGGDPGMVAARSLRHYGARVRANRRRLTR